MTRYIESPSTDPYFNLSLEQYVFDKMDHSYRYFMLWRNENTIVVGKHQNTIEEINAAYVKEHGVRVVRRLSGGGAVYHDLGNVNFTFIADCKNLDTFDFAAFCAPVVKALKSLGVKAEISGRNDMIIGGKKFSGNSQYMKQGRIMHHGTILYDSDLDAVERALTVSTDKFESKGLKSIRSRITNIRPYITGQDFTAERFMCALRDFMLAEHSMTEYKLMPADIRAVSALQKDVYESWEWNYGVSPAFRVHKQRRVEGCGKLEIFLNVEEGIIHDIAFYGDYFGNGDTSDLKNRLKGRLLKEAALRAALAGVSVEHYFSHMDMETFLTILLQ